jgi:hypothetical protein
VDTIRAQGHGIGVILVDLPGFGGQFAEGLPERFLGDEAIDDPRPGDIDRGRWGTSLVVASTHSEE